MKALISALFLLGLASASVWAQTPESGREAWLARRAQAEALREEAKETRRESAARREQADADCVGKLLVNACHQKALNAYLAQIKRARDKEIEANRIDTEAKAALAKLDEREREARAEDSARQSAPVLKAEPRERPAPLSEEDEARFEAEKLKRREAAEKRRAKAASEAHARAEKRKEDAERYEAREKAVAERKLKQVKKKAELQAGDRQ